uniref:Uncharacterized protein n=1 Tax=Anguilla anguilla TaxID=7936 RepID=A0A0E9SVB5_ANGAN
MIQNTLNHTAWVFKCNVPFA